MFRQVSFGAAAVLVAGALAVGCSDSDDGSNIFLAGGTTEATRADSVSTRLEDSWADNEASINRGPAAAFGSLRVFRNTNGEGIAIWTQGDTGTEQLWVAHFGASGGMDEPFNVASDADADFAGNAFAKSVAQAVAGFAPNGQGAAIAFIARQAATPGVAATTDVESDRVYYLTYDGAFDLQGPIDTNTGGTTGDDNDVNTLFAVTTLVDGMQTYAPTGNDLNERPIGPKNDSVTNVVPGFAFGWVYQTGTPETRIEGRFVDLDDGTLGTIQQVNIPNIGTGEAPSTTIKTSGNEMLVQWTDDPAGNANGILVLYRLDFTGAGSFGTGIVIDRGAPTGDEVVQNATFVQGDGVRSLNGSNATIILYESTHVDATIDADNDLMAARVDAAGAVTQADIDHDDNVAVTSNPLVRYDVQFERGMPAVWIYYLQVVDPAAAATANNIALFVRYLRLDEGSTIAEALSVEDQVNTTNNDDATDTLGDVVNFFFADTDPFCDPDPNNEATFVVFIQQAVDVNTTTTETNHVLRGSLITVADMLTDPPVVTAGADTILQADTDLNWGDSVSNAGRNPIVLPSSDPSGTGIVLWVQQQNNLSNNAPAGGGQFTNLRAVVSSTALPTGATTSQALPTTQIGSGSTATNLSFADFGQVTTDGVLAATVTPHSAAERDFTFDEDEAAPQFAFFVIPEFVGDNVANAGETYRGRTLNLATQAFANVNERFFPLLTAEPEEVGTAGQQFDDLATTTGELQSTGNGVLFVFNQEGGNAATGTNGRFYANTASSDGNWSNAALISNDEASELAPGNVLLFVPGVENQNCESAVGSWFFYVRQDENANTANQDVRELQGRRFTSTSLSPQ